MTALRTIVYPAARAALGLGLLAAALLAGSGPARGSEQEVRKGDDSAKRLREATKGANGGVAAARPSGPAAPAHPNHRSAPARRAGWWEFAAAPSKEKPLDAYQLCIGPRSEQRLSAFDQIADPEECGKAELKKAGAGWSFVGTCEYEDGIAATIKGTISGDFQKAYTVELTITPQDAGAARQITMTARYLGSCPAGRKEGDEVTGGTVKNVLEP